MASRQYHFRAFRLDPAARELWKDAELVVLPGSALDCLVYLVEHRERAVGRDELIAAVWGRVDVADTLLAQTVLRVRRTLGDSGSDGAIRTVARFGYRWVEETRIEEPSASAGGSADPALLLTTVGEPADEASVSGDTRIAAASVDEAGLPGAPGATGTPRVSANRKLFLAAGLVLLAVFLVPLLMWRSTQWMTLPEVSRGEEAVTPPTLVLPAEVTDAADWGWLRLGLMDLIGNRLRQGGLPTAPGETVLAMIGAHSSLPDGDPASLHVQPRAMFRDGNWVVTLQARRGSDAAQVEAVSEDVLKAARIASDLLLVRLGLAPPKGADLTRPLALEELLQRTKSAILADQFDLALHLIDQAPPDLRAHEEVELRLAQIEQGRGAYEASEIRLLALLDRVRTGNEPVLRARILNALGATQFRRGQAEAATRSYAEAIEILETVHEPILLASAYSGRAAIASQEERLDAAAADLGRARVEMEAGGDALGIAQVDMNLGLIEARNYRPSQAAQMLQGAESRIAALGAREELAYVRYALVNAQLQLLEYENAQATVARFWPPENHTGNERLRWRLTLTKAFVLHATGRLDEAEHLLERIDREADDADDATVHARGRALSVLVLAARGRHEDAAAMALTAMTSSFAEQQPDMYLTIWAARLRSLRSSGQLAQAAIELPAIGAWVRTHPNVWRTASFALAEAEQAWAEGRVEPALERFADAFARMQALAIPDDLVEAGVPYALALVDGGNVDQASAVVGRIAAWADNDLRAAWAQTQLYRAQSRTAAWQRSSERLQKLAGERVLPVPRID